MTGSLPLQPQRGSQDDLSLVIMGKPRGALAKRGALSQTQSVPSPLLLIGTPLQPWPSSVGRKPTVTGRSPVPLSPGCCCRHSVCVLPCSPREQFPVAGVGRG